MKTMCFLDHFSGRVLVFFLFSCFLDRFFGRVLVFLFSFINSHLWLTFCLHIRTYTSSHAFSLNISSYFLLTTNVFKMLNVFPVLNIFDMQCVKRCLWKKKHFFIIYRRPELWFTPYQSNILIRRIRIQAFPDLSPHFLPLNQIIFNHPLQRK